MSARGAWLTGLLLLLLLAGVMLAGIALGGAPGFGPLRALATLLGRPETGPEGRILSALVFDIRLPRVVLLALAGAAFAAAGAALQAVLDNPLADPGLLGLSGGASLGAVLAYATGAYALWSASVPLAAFLGALVAVLVVYLVAHAAGPPGDLRPAAHRGGHGLPAGGGGLLPAGELRRLPGARGFRLAAGLRGESHLGPRTDGRRARAGRGRGAGALRPHHRRPGSRGGARPGHRHRPGAFSAAGDGAGRPRRRRGGQRGGPGGFRGPDGAPPGALGGGGGGAETAAAGRRGGGCLPGGL
ncbi:MAG: iron chelate uptake ABC transporter family permease subunit [Acidobacteriota bacterium]|nr:iron chelate uptake ABC transporter family permease subunit [Acidobacteriota bacterium]